MLIKLLKGVLVGIGAILPGLSGGMLAASMHIYTDLIEALNDFSRKPFAAAKRIWHYLIGIVLGVLIGFLFIALLYQYIPIPTTFVFLGIILSTLPEYYQKIEIKTLKLKHYLVMIITILVIVGTLFLKVSQANLENSIPIMIVVGILLALSLIIPGLSGTMILMALGFYKPLVEMFKSLMDALIAIDFNKIFSHLPFVIILGISGLISMILLAKFVTHLVKNHERLFDCTIFSIILVSPVSILYSLYLDDKSIFKHTSPWIYAVSILLLVLSFIVTYKLSLRKDEQNENETNSISS